MKRTLLNFVSDVSLWTVAWLVAVRVVSIALPGIALVWLTGISWAFLLPVCVAIGLLALLLEDGFLQTSLARRRHDPTP